VSVSPDRVLRLWNLEIGLEIAAFTTGGPIFLWAVAPDHQTIIAVETEGPADRAHFLQVVEADETEPPMGDAKIQLLDGRNKPKNANGGAENRVVLLTRKHLRINGFSPGRSIAERWD
jgi:hypothetical protein